MKNTKFKYMDAAMIAEMDELLKSEHRETIIACVKESVRIGENIGMRNACMFAVGAAGAYVAIRISKAVSNVRRECKKDIGKYTEERNEVEHT